MSKKVMVLWFLVIFIMCATLVVIHYNTLDKRLIEIEKTLKVASRDYFRDNDMMPSLNESSVVKVEDLIELDYVDEDEMSKIDKYCIKSVKVVNKLFIPVYEVIKDCKEVIKEVIKEVSE